MKTAGTPVKPDAGPLPKFDNAAQVITGTSAAFEDGEHLHRIRRTDRPAHPALRINPLRQMRMRLGHHPNWRRNPA